MKGVIAVCLFALAASALARPEEKYTDQWDYINVREVVENKKLMKQYVDCCMERGKCTAEGKELKSNISDALKSNCSKCTDAQKEGVKVVIGHLINHVPEAWAELKQKYDPTGEYSKKYEDQLKAVQH